MLQVDSVVITALNTKTSPTFLILKFCANAHFCIVSRESPETLQKLCLWTKFPPQIIRRNLGVLTLKRLGEGGGSIWPLTPCGFSENVSSKERVKPWFFVTFSVILRHIFPENFIEFSLVVQKIWTISLPILAIFIHFHRFFWIFWHYLVTKKLMSSAYNRSCRHFFNFNIL